MSYILEESQVIHLIVESNPYIEQNVYIVLSRISLVLSIEKNIDKIHESIMPNIQQNVIITK